MIFKKALSFAVLGAAVILTGTDVRAEVRTRTVEYRQGSAVLQGYLAYNDKAKGKRPGVLVVHDWMGLGENAKSVAKRLAKVGYVAFAADIYGKGIRPKNAQEAGAQASIYKGDRKLLRARMDAALQTLRKEPMTDASRIAAIGYCFGGTAVLEQARAGSDVKGVVSFHGGLDTPLPAAPGAIKAKVLVLHGAEDPYAPAEQVRAFEDEMRKAGADWQVTLYSGAVHAFTNPEAGSDPSKGVAYNAKAAWRSWAAMRIFLKEIFGGKK